MQLKTVSDFKSAIDSIGFDKFWEMYINAYLSRIRPDFNLPSGNLEFDINSPIFSFDSIGELYEIALEHNDQITKKELGQYYTPKDVCCFMAKKLIYGQDQKSNLADVCCGTGNLIIEVLNQLGAEETRKLIDKKHLFLYDLDPTAIKLYAHIHHFGSVHYLSSKKHVRRSGPESPAQSRKVQGYDSSGCAENAQTSN